MHHIYELLKFIEKSEKIHTYSFHSISSVYKVLRLNLLYFICNKKDKFLIDF
jgi:hypothetical protein